MASWNNKAWESIVADYPVLEGKSETVAFITWILRDNPDIEPADLRAAGEQYGVSVAGRAIGSAREILGITKPKPGGKKKGRKKKGRKKKTGAKRGRKATSSGARTSFDGMSDIYKALDSLKEMERQNSRMRDSLAKIRDQIDKALA